MNLDKAMTHMIRLDLGNKERSDKNKKFTKFKVNDLVLVKNNHISPKLDRTVKKFLKLTIAHLK